MEEQREADDGGVDGETANNGHGSRTACDLLRVPEECGKRDSHDDEESGKESSKIDHSVP